MINFEYKGISAGKYVEGEIEAINNSEAAYKLKEQKVIITINFLIFCVFTFNFITPLILIIQIGV